MPSPAPLRPPARTLGRYELRQLLGQGGQSAVWRAFDPRLDREVALKLHRAQASDGEALTQWLHEARAVARLSHPNIVPLFEADVHDQHPYLVFELVEGPTLSQRLREQGALAPAEAVRVLLGVLDGVVHAHQSGVIHRDLKPSNILIDAAGRARVMDFGIAVNQRHGMADAALVGTPGYMAPELTQGRPATVQADVFAAGLVLYEMLAGRPAVRESDPYKALHRLAHEDVSLPAELPHPVDDGLRAVVHRATARDTAVRYANAAEMAKALQAWLAPQAEGSEASRNSTLEFLLRRMRHKTDFPALTDAVGRIQRIAASEHESLNSLANEILKDVALTNKLLRIVNSAHFRTAGGGTISTVSRAAALVGFAGIRNLALSLVVLEHMQDKAQAGSLREEFLRSLMAGNVARELAAGARDAEEAFISALFQNLGRTLAQFYFPEEAAQVRQLMQPDGSDALTEEQAAVRILGIRYEELGVGVARHWGLPEALQRSMRKLPTEGPLKKPEGPLDRVRMVACAANELADAVLHHPRARHEEALKAVAARYAAPLGLADKDFLGAVQRSRERMAELVPAMDIQVTPGSRSERLMKTQAATQAAPSDALSAHDLDTVVLAREGGATTTATAPPEQAAQGLAAGIQDISNALVEGFKLNEVLRMVLESMYRSLGFQRVLFCLRDPRSGAMTGRFGLGADAQQVAGLFRIDLAPSATDLFALVCKKGADTLISDATVPNIAERLPGWYRREVGAPTFLLLPMSLRNAPLGLIYADRAAAGEIAIGERELSLLRTLRNQAVMAFKQATP
ncbi:serine/threonine protein kinase [Caldimonas caldifontis]|uniref:Serine/threonine protein kinase n=1 Tax=Caldimonas caldifontis TaxID=1452508 RepID=A0A2S5ST67_9BURK|nr:serine/threonine protein kinase [Caldimonas caldifontis]PPE65899.1 serine/threonine protein kinase [Caldimonas caldifontis]